MIDRILPARIEFTVAGNPEPAPRPRRAANGGVFTPDTDEGWKQSVYWAARPHLPAQPWSGPVRMSIVLFLVRPDSLMHRSDPDGPVFAPARGTGDWDNLGKPICDALEHIPEKRKTPTSIPTRSCRPGLYLNDSQVVWAELVKLYHAKGAGPGAWIVAELLPGIVPPAHLLPHASPRSS